MEYYSIWMHTQWQLSTVRNSPILKLLEKCEHSNDLWPLPVLGLAFCQQDWQGVLTALSHKVCSCLPIFSFRIEGYGGVSWKVQKQLLISPSGKYLIMSVTEGKTGRFRGKRKQRIVQPLPALSVEANGPVLVPAHSRACSTANVYPGC